MASEDSKPTRAIEASMSWQEPTYAGAYGLDRSDYFGTFGYAAPTPPPLWLDSQKRGEALPFYIDENALRAIRNKHRWICAQNEFAVCGIENRISYTVGSGFSYRVIPAHDDVHDDELIKKTQRIVDIFVESNCLWEREAETVFRDDRDGESFTRIFYKDSGLLVLRWVEPEHVKAPNGESYNPGKSFGVETDPHDIADVKAYWIVENPLRDTNATLRVPACDMVHTKRNVDSAAKRGLPLYYPVESNLRRAEELLAAMTTTAKTRAKIALIRRIDGAAKPAAQRMKDELESNAQAVDPTTGGVTNIEQFPLGTILTASKNIEYEYPDATKGASDTVEVLKAELRAIAARLVMPEIMLTANAGDGTYASQLVAEAPATRNFERLQRFYRGVFGESRAPGREALVWRQIRYAVKCGILPQRVLTDIRIIARAPSIIPRDPDKAAVANKTYLDAGVKSPQAVTEELGYNWAQTQREREEAGLPSIEELSGATLNPMGTPQEAGDPGDEQVEGEDETGDYSFDSSTFSDL